MTIYRGVIYLIPKVGIPNFREIINQILLMSLIKIQKKGQITLPTEVREKMALYAGDVVDVKIKAAQIVITPQTIIDRSGFPNADDEYTPEQRAIVDAQLAEALKSPTHGPFDTAEEAIKFMRQELKIRKNKQKSNSSFNKGD